MLEMLPVENFKNSNPPIFCLSASEPDYLPCAMPRDPVFSHCKDYFVPPQIYCYLSMLLIKVATYMIYMYLIVFLFLAESRSKSVITMEHGVSFVLFCFPYGKGDVNIVNTYVPHVTSHMRC